VAQLEYHVLFKNPSSGRHLSLIDRGANGGVAGDDVCIIFRTSRTVDIKGIDNHHVNDIGIGTVAGDDVCIIFCTSWTADIKGIDNHHVNDIGIGTVGSVVNTQHGLVIAIMQRYALLGTRASIHSPCQFEWYKNDVNDKSTHIPGGLQRITTLDGNIIPLSIKVGLVCPQTDHEFDTLPRVFFTSELEWDPTVLDHEFDLESQYGDVYDPCNASMSTTFRIFYVRTGHYLMILLISASWLLTIAPLVLV
jgi:hypothetical protein